MEIRITGVFAEGLGRVFLPEQPARDARIVTATITERIRDWMPVCRDCVIARRCDSGVPGMLLRIRSPKERARPGRRGAAGSAARTWFIVFRLHPSAGAGRLRACGRGRLRSLGSASCRLRSQGLPRRLLVTGGVPLAPSHRKISGEDTPCEKLSSSRL